jgi:hypothetical protein
MQMSLRESNSKSQDVWAGAETECAQNWWLLRREWIQGTQLGEDYPQEMRGRNLAFVLGGFLWFCGTESVKSFGRVGLQRLLVSIQKWLQILQDLVTHTNLK